MRRHAFDLAVLFVIASAIAGYFALAQPGLRSIALHVYVLVLGGLAMLAIVSSIGERAPRRRTSPFDAAIDRSRSPAQPIADLERLIRETTLATTSAYDFQLRLVPHLREIAWAGIERSGRIPGPDTLGRWWPLLDPERDEPLDRRANGIDERELSALVAELARM